MTAQRVRALRPARLHNRIAAEAALLCPAGCLAGCLAGCCSPSAPLIGAICAGDKGWGCVSCGASSGPRRRLLIMTRAAIAALTAAALLRPAGQLREEARGRLEAEGDGKVGHPLWKGRSQGQAKGCAQDVEHCGRRHCPGDLGRVQGPAGQGDTRAAAREPRPHRGHQHCTWRPARPGSA